MGKINEIVGVTFLNEKSFDKDFYLNLLIEGAESKDFSEKDKTVYDEVIDAIKKKKFVLNSQEMTFVQNYPEKAFDYILFRYKFRVYPEKRILTDFPLYLLIEPTSICNLRCKMCFQMDKFFADKSKMGFIDFDFYKNLIDQAVEGGTGALTMASRGEPLLNKQFDKMLDYAGGKFFELKVNTNAMLMDEKMSHKLLENDITDLVFSIDSADKKQYEEMRKGAKFDTVLANIKQFNKIREKHYPNSKTVTRISGVKCGDNQDMDKLVEFWSEHVDEVAYVNCIDRKDSYNNDATKMKTPCNLLWSRMYIWWDGICNPCDFDFRSNLDIGNVKDSSIKGVWLGERLQKIRESHLAGNRDDNHPCNVCEI